MEGPLTTAARALIAADNDLKLATAAHADNEKHRLAHGLPDSVMEVTHDQLEAARTAYDTALDALAAALADDGQSDPEPEQPQDPAPNPPGGQDDQGDQNGQGS